MALFDFRSKNSLPDTWLLFRRSNRIGHAPLSPPVTASYCISPIRCSFFTSSKRVPMFDLVLVRSWATSTFQISRFAPVPKKVTEVEDGQRARYTGRRTSQDDC